MRSIQSASSDASCTMTTSLGNALCKNCEIGDTYDGSVPSVQNSAFFRCNFDVNFSLCFRDDDDDDVVDDDDDADATVFLVVFAVLLELPLLAVCDC